MKTCPACRSEIHTEARVCPACRTIFDASDMMAGRSQSNRRYLFRLLAVAAGIFVIVYWLNNGGIEALVEVT
jgi:predicted amidophosphoribosyltransferase